MTGKEFQQNVSPTAPGTFGVVMIAEQTAWSSRVTMMNTNVLRSGK